MTNFQQPPPAASPARSERTTRRAVRTDIQALRGLAVAAVLGYHFAPSWVPGGYVGVDIFFVISGFVITTLMITELRETGRLSFSKFYARRARRILPAATVTTIITVVAGLVLLPLNRWEPLASDALFTATFAQNWHLAAESVDYLAGGQLLSPMQHFWSLSIEEQFYFLWPVALIAAYAIIRRYRRAHPGELTARAAPAAVTAAGLAVLLPVILGSFAASISAVSHGSAAAYFTSHTRAWQLAVGALLAVCWPAVGALTGNSARNGKYTPV